MLRRLLAGAIFLSGIVLLISSCKDLGNAPPVITPIPVPAGGLNANPPSVTLASGQLRQVQISGGILPYQVVTAPDPTYASAVFVDPNVEPATLNITGVSNASVSGSTYVKVKSSSSSQEDTVRIPITKTP
jgi:hypothetical protein